MTGYECTLRMIIAFIMAPIAGYAQSPFARGCFIFACATWIAGMTYKMMKAEKNQPVNPERKDEE